jgi:hypothetical protein
MRQTCMSTICRCDGKPLMRLMFSYVNDCQLSAENSSHTVLHSDDGVNWPSGEALSCRACC